MMQTLLRSRLDDLRADVAARVARDGAERHQVAVDRYVWCHAQSDAAAALRALAEDTGDTLAARMAEAAEAEAGGMLDGASAAASISQGERYASIAHDLRSLDDLGLDQTHRMLRATLADFAEREIRPLAQEIHRRNLDIPERVISGAASLGLFGLSIPEEYGGTLGEDSALSMLVTTEALSRVSLPVGGSLVTRPEILVRALLRAGTAAQKRRWLPRIASGELMVAIAVTEPGAGSDMAALRCRAVRTEAGWEINGTKLWSTFAGRAELLMLLCRTSDAGHRGLSLFVAEKPASPGEVFEHRQPVGGVLRGRAIPTIGYRGLHTFELAFDRYLLPPDALVGGDDWRDRGFYLQLEGFAFGRLQTAGRAIGLANAALDAGRAYTAVRTMFGKREIEFPLVRAKLGEMATAFEAARRLAYRAARAYDEREDGGTILASLAKLYASRVAERATREAQQLHGGMGYGEETEVSRLFVDARVLAIFEGAEDVLSLRVIGKALLEREAD